MEYCYSLLMEYTLFMYFKIHYGVWYVTWLLWNRRKEKNVPNHKGFQPELYKMKKAEQKNNVVYIDMKWQKTTYCTNRQWSNLNRQPESGLQTATEQKKAILKVLFTIEMFSF